MALAMGTRTEAPGRRLLDAVCAVESIPILGSVGERVHTLLGAGAPQPYAIADEAERDLGLTIRVLVAANRAGAPCEGTTQAVQAVAPEPLRTLVAEAPAFNLLEPAGPWGWQLHRERRHALGVQAVALRVARLLGVQDRDGLALAALLHDVGRLMLTIDGRSVPERGTPLERLKEERRELGMDHAMLGGIAARRWRLPAAIERAVSGHHSAGDGLAGIVRLADALWHHATRAPAPAHVAAAAEPLGLSTSDVARLLEERPGPADRAAPRARAPSPLSRRQSEIIRLLGEGKSYKEIAAELGLSTSTLRSHLSHAYRKLGVSDRAQAVLAATRNDWI